MKEIESLKNYSCTQRLITNLVLIELSNKKYVQYSKFLIKLSLLELCSLLSCVVSLTVSIMASRLKSGGAVWVVFYHKLSWFMSQVILNYLKRYPKCMS